MQSVYKPQWRLGAFITLLLLTTQSSFAGNLCGNSLIDIQAAEQCDDGNFDDGDGCSRTCQIETHWDCTQPYLPAAQDNLVQFPGFEEDALSVWENSSSFEPVICNLEQCSPPIGGRQGAGWAQLGGVPNQDWKLSQVLDNFGPQNLPYWLQFDVINASCALDAQDVFDILLDGQSVWSTTNTDQNCTQPNQDFQYRHVLVDIREFFPPGTTPSEITLLADAPSGEFTVGIDNIQITTPAGPPVPSVCTLQTNVVNFEDFEGIGDFLGPPDFEQFPIGEIDLPWGTTDDGFCGAFQNPPGNHTGEPGAAACIDSTDFNGPPQPGNSLIETYVCQAPVDLSFYLGTNLQFVVNYQPLEFSSQDFFGVWIGNEPFMGPLEAGINSANFLTNQPLGEFGQAPGVPLTVFATEVDLTEPVYVCFGYGNEGPGYAQFDTVALRFEGCIDDFEEDKIGSCDDNCTLVPNPDQTDSDGDGYGNACDADVARTASVLRAIPSSVNGNDCVVNFQDLVVINQAFFSSPIDPKWNPDADFNNDSKVNFLDLAIFSEQFLSAPGPSGATRVCGGVGGGT